MDTSPSPLKTAAAGMMVVGVAFGMARYAYGATLPLIRSTFDLSEVLLGAIAGGTYVGFLLGLLLTVPVARRFGPRAPTTWGGVCGAAGALTVCLAPDPVTLATGAIVASSAAGWVWTPYSSIVAGIARASHQPRLLGIITTGTALGLIALGLLLLVGQWWRAVWAVIGVLAAGAALVNVRWTPRRVTRIVAHSKHQASMFSRSIGQLLAYSVIYFFICIGYFTYAADAAAAAGLGGAATGIIFGVIGTTALLGMFTGRWTTRFGSRGLSGASLLVTGIATITLGMLAHSLLATVVSAAIFGAGYMVGSAVLAIWAAEAVPDRPTEALTAALVVGAISSIATPVLIGTLREAIALSTILTLIGVTGTGIGAVVCTYQLHRRPRRPHFQ